MSYWRKTCGFTALPSGVVPFAKRRHNLTDILSAVLRHDEQCITRVHHDQVVDTDQRHELAVRCCDVVAAGADSDAAFGQYVGLLVLRCELPCRRPAPEVGPLERPGYYADRADLLHDAVVDAHGGQVGVRLFDQGRFPAGLRRLVVALKLLAEAGQVLVDGF